MLEIDHFKKRIEKKIGSIQNIILIEKGFSIEKKFKITTDEGDYLVRLSPVETFASKVDEFELMRRLHEMGVLCNNPIIMFRDDEKRTVCALYSYISGITEPTPSADALTGAGKRSFRKFLNQNSKV